MLSDAPCMETRALMLLPRWLFLRTGFPDGEIARVVICIATINRYSHWGTLYALYEWLSVPDHVAELEDSSPVGLNRGGKR